MLHILFLILKIILILLAIVLGLVILAVLLILFCPIRYRATVVKESDSIQDIDISGRVSWLFGVISLKAVYRERESDISFNILGVPVQKIINLFRKHKSGNKNNNSNEEYLKDEPTNPTSNATDEQNKSSNDTKQITDNQQTESETTDTSTASDHPQDDSALTEDELWLKEKFCKLFYKLGDLFGKIHNIYNNFISKIKGVPPAVSKFKLTIDGVYAKIDWYKKFWNHPRTQSAYKFIKERAIRLLKHIFPTKIRGEVTFGSTDPSTTGKVLAILGMTIPFHKNKVRVTPLFEDKDVLIGNAEIRGRLYGVVLIKLALELYFNKNIKYIIRRFKHREV